MTHIPLYIAHQMPTYGITFTKLVSAQFLLIQ